MVFVPVRRNVEASTPDGNDVVMDPTTMHWWTVPSGVALAAMHRLLVRTTPAGRQPHRHYPERCEFLEQSGMARAMHRL